MCYKGRMKKRLPLENELRHVLQIKPKLDEDRQDYLKRLVFKADAVDDEVWSSLSQNAQDWLKANSMAVEGDRELSDFNSQNTFVEISAPKNFQPQNLESRQEQNKDEDLSIDEYQDEGVVEVEEVIYEPQQAEVLANVSGTQFLRMPKLTPDLADKEAFIDHTKTPVKDMELKYIEHYTREQLDKKKRQRKTGMRGPRFRKRIANIPLTFLILWPDPHMALPEFAHRFLTDRRCDTVSWQTAKHCWQMFQQSYAIIQQFEKKGLPDGEKEAIEVTGKGYTKSQTKRPYNLYDYRKERINTIINEAENSL